MRKEGEGGGEGPMPRIMAKKLRQGREHRREVVIGRDGVCRNCFWDRLNSVRFSSKGRKE